MEATLNQQRLKELDASGRIIVTLYRDRVYDVTDFVEDHPGGEEIITELKNEDITQVMNDPDLHTHSQAAYEVLEDYFIGKCDDPVASDSSEAMLLQQTEYEQDYKTNQFLDLGRPLLMQMLTSKWTREFYVQQVHKPRHYGKGSAPIFGNFLEPLSKTPWWLIPLVHLPMNVMFAHLALQGLSVYTFASLYVFGVFFWTLIEYSLHRFLFHLDDHLPQNQYAFTLHFLLHGVHHFLPMDRLRLVMPPALMVVLATPLYKLCHFIFREYYISQAIFSGAYLGYILYDCTHYFLHHKQLPLAMKPLKNFHLDHHYKDYELGFGVTTRFWDFVFGTQFVDTSRS